MKTNINKTLYFIVLSIFVAISFSAKGEKIVPININTVVNEGLPYVDVDSFQYPIYSPHIIGTAATSIAAASSSLTTSLLMKTTEGAIEGFMLGSLNAVVDGKDWKTALQDGAEEGTYGAIMSAATVGVQAIAPKTAKNYSVYYGYDKEGKV